VVFKNCPIIRTLSANFPHALLNSEVLFSLSYQWYTWKAAWPLEFALWLQRSSPRRWWDRQSLFQLFLKTDKVSPRQGCWGWDTKGRSRKLRFRAFSVLLFQLKLLEIWLQWFARPSVKFNSSKQNTIMSELWLTLSFPERAWQKICFLMHATQRQLI